MKKCPYCAEVIQDEAIKCKHCGEMLNKSSQASAPKQPEKKIGGCSVIIIVILALWAIGTIVTAVEKASNDRQTNEERKKIAALKAKQEAEAKKKQQEEIEQDRKNLDSLYNEANSLINQWKLVEADTLITRIIRVDSGFKDIASIKKKLDDQLANLSFKDAEDQLKKKNYRSAVDSYREVKKRAHDFKDIDSKIQKALDLLDEQNRMQEVQAEHQKTLEDMKKYFTNKVDIAVTNVDESNSIYGQLGSNYPDAGKKFIKIFVFVHNGSSSEHHANPNNFTLIDSENLAYHYDANTHAIDNSFPAVDLIAGTDTKGWLIFQIESSNKPSKLIYQGMWGGQAEKRITYTE